MIYRIDVLRVATGALWTSNFTPPTSMYDPNTTNPPPHNGSISIPLYLSNKTELNIASPHDGEIIIELNFDLGQIQVYPSVSKNQISVNLNLLNGFNVDVEFEIGFINALTEGIDFGLGLYNSILGHNEVSTSINLYNRLLSGVVFESYDGFYFSKIHGV